MDRSLRSGRLARRARPSRREPGRVRRPLARNLGIVLAGLGLTLLFLLGVFPYDRYRPLLERTVSEAVGVPVRIGGVAPVLARDGPGLGLRRVTLALPGRRPLAIDELRVRPALSPSWLGLDPAWHVGGSSEAGEVRGTLWLGGRAGFRGALRDVELETLPLDAIADGLRLHGRADFALDVTHRGAGLAGTIVLSAREGSVTIPPDGVPVPFASAEGALELDPDDGIRVDSFTLEDPMLSLAAQGTIGTRPSLEHGRLALTARFEIRDPGMRDLVATAIPLGRDGRGNLRVGGSLARPILR